MKTSPYLISAGLKIIIICQYLIKNIQKGKSSVSSVTFTLKLHSLLEVIKGLYIFFCTYI